MVGGGAVAAPQPAEDDQAQFVQYASARRTERLEQQKELTELLLRGPQSPADGARGLTGSLFSSEMLRVLSEARDPPTRG